MNNLTNMIKRRQSIKLKIFEHLDTYGYINDTDVAKILGKEPNWCTVEEYKRQWNKLQSDRHFFADKKITHAHKGSKTRAMVDTRCGSYIVGKEFFEEIIQNMAVDTSRPDLRLKMYRKNNE